MFCASRRAFEQNGECLPASSVNASETFEDENFAAGRRPNCCGIRDAVAVCGRRRPVPVLSARPNVSPPPLGIGRREPNNRLPVVMDTNAGGAHESPDVVVRKPAEPLVPLLAAVVPQAVMHEAGLRARLLSHAPKANARTAG